MRYELVVQYSNSMDSESFKFFNPFAETSEARNRLPHWEQAGVLYFVTFRLADSIPSHLMENWKSDRAIWAGLHPQPWSVETEREYHERFSGSVERWLDAGHGECCLRDGVVRGHVSKALEYFDGKRCHVVS